MQFIGSRERLQGLGRGCGVSGISLPNARREETTDFSRHNAIFYSTILSVLFIFCSWVYSVSFLLAQEEQKKKEIIYESLGLRDPMMPLVTTSGLIRDFEPAGAHSDLHLEGIIYDENNNSMAIIDGQIVKGGDVVRGARILEIQEDGVVIQKDGQLREIKLEEE